MLRTATPKSLAKEQHLTFPEAARLIPGRPHLNTVRRWAGRGYNGVVLESWRFANRRVTTVEALERFFAATNQVDDPNPRQSDQVRAAQDAAADKLDALGIK